VVKDDKRSYNNYAGNTMRYVKMVKIGRAGKGAVILTGGLVVAGSNPVAP